MAKPLRILEEAIAEGRDAWRWYQERSERAAERFQRAFEHAIEDVRANPEGWPEYILATRFRRLRRFPYLLVYRETDHEIQVIAVAHGHRREGYWRTRLP